jgi:hypothetical protein
MLGQSLGVRFTHDNRLSQRQRETRNAQPLKRLSERAYLLGDTRDGS